MSSGAVDYISTLETLGKIAAPAGLAIGVFLFISKDILAKNIFPQLGKKDSVKIIIHVAWMAWSIAIAGIVAWLVSQYFSHLPTPPPGQASAPSFVPSNDTYRLGVRVVNFGFDEDPPFLLEKLTLEPIGDNPLLVNSLSVGVIATSKKDASILARRFDLVKNVAVSKDTILPIDLKQSVDSWLQMSQPTDQRPSPDGYLFGFHLQVQATDVHTGKETWLDVDAPSPPAMTCKKPCWALFDFKVPAGQSAHKSCTAINLGGQWRLDCSVQEQ